MYNTDMNRIVYAGQCNKIADSENLNSAKYLKVFCENTKSGKVYARSDFEMPADNALCVVLERATAPYGITFELCEPESTFVRQAAQQAAHYFESEKPKKELALCALGELICAYINLAQTDGNKLSPVVVSVRENADKNLTDTAYSQEDFLKKLPLNYDYVRKLFKKETGETPHEYLLRRKMELAANLLSGAFTNKYSNYSVSQVAEACGFADALYFSRVFKKYFGTSPSDYAKK